MSWHRPYDVTNRLKLLMFDGIDSLAAAAADGISTRHRAADKSTINVPERCMRLHDPGELFAVLLRWSPFGWHFRAQHEMISNVLARARSARSWTKASPSVLRACKRHRRHTVSPPSRDTQVLNE